ncbi:MAG: hypothetical protein ACT4O1_09095 [Gemmatimonadota bacterium]
MHRTMLAIAAAAMLMMPASVAAQEIRTQGRTSECAPDTRTGARTRGQPSAQFRDYDIVLEVPDLCVRHIKLAVRNLDAHVSLNATIANLVRVQAGADVSIKSVDLTIQGVRVEALLLVDLDNVAYIVDRTLTMLDNNPQIVRQLYGTVQGAVGTVGGLVQTAIQPGGVLSQTVNALGQTVMRTVDTTGRIVERILDTTGRIVGENVVGNVTSMSVVRETAGATGQTVKQVRDASGKIIEFTLDAAGRVTNARVLQ